MTTTVWLTTWQLGDDGVHVAVGDRIGWLACLPTDWAGQRLFGGRRTIDLEVDAHRADGYFVEESGAVVHSDGRVWSVRGVVAGVESVTIEYLRGRMGDEPVDGSAVTEAIAATDERSWGMCRAHDAAGFIVTLRDEQVEPTEPTLARSVWHAEPLPVVEIDREEASAQTTPEASGWPGPVVDAEPWAPLHPVEPDLREGETAVYFASYAEPADAAAHCRHPSHRA